MAGAKKIMACVADKINRIGSYVVIGAMLRLVSRSPPYLLHPIAIGAVSPEEGGQCSLVWEYKKQHMCCIMDFCNI